MLYWLICIGDQDESQNEGDLHAVLVNLHTGGEGESQREGDLHVVLVNLHTGGGSEGRPSCCTG